MRVVYDDESGDVVVVLMEVPASMVVHATHQYQKFGVTMYWDGHGGLLGFGLSQEVSTRPELIVAMYGDKVPLRDQQPLVESRG